MSTTLSKSVLFCAFLATAAWDVKLCGQSPDGVAETASSPFKYRTSVDCIRCHTGGHLPNAIDGDARLAMDEASIWRSQDKHAKAYEVLHGERSKRIGALLVKDVLEASTGCIQCHTANVEHEDWLDANPQRIASGLSEGVSCEACHGPSSEWYDMHTLSSWREKSQEQKTELGFVPLQNSVVRAETCLACHLGSAAEDRVITHEMYAAGHPLLSGFEPESAAERMPRHWRYQAGNPTSGDAFVRTRHALTASAVGLRMAVELTVESGAGSSPGAPGWPELARLDCFGCHHDLRPDSWRQHRQTDSRAGRTELALSCIPLVRIAARAAKGPPGDQELEAVLRSLRAPFDRAVFGDKSQLDASGPGVTAWCRELESELGRMPLDDERVAQIFADLVAQAQRESGDFDVARQLAGAAAMMFAEVRVALPEQKASQASVPIDRLFEEFELESSPGALIEDSLPQALARRARYTPAAFRREFRALQAIIAP